MVSVRAEEGVAEVIVVLHPCRQTGNVVYRLHGRIHAESTHNHTRLAEAYGIHAIRNRIEPVGIDSDLEPRLDLRVGGDVSTETLVLIHVAYNDTIVGLHVEREIKIRALTGILERDGMFGHCRPLEGLIYPVGAGRSVIVGGNELIGERTGLLIILQIFLRIHHFRHAGR